MRVSHAEVHPCLEIDVRGEASRHRVHMSGDLDAATAPRLEQVVERRVAAASEIVLDLHDVSFMDSTGLRAILTCKELCRRNDCAFALTHGPAQVQRLFETCGLIERLPFVQDE